MARILFESHDRDEAHAKQAHVIAEGSAPFACCTEHVERGDTVVVWTDTPAAYDLQVLARTDVPARPTPTPPSRRARRRH